MRWLLLAVAAVCGYLLGYRVAARYEVTVRQPEEGVQPMDPRLVRFTDVTTPMRVWGTYSGPQYPNPDEEPVNFTKARN